MQNFSVLLVISLALIAAPRHGLGAPKTMKDLAIKEARQFDKDHNNKIGNLEAFDLRNEFKTNASSHLYMFDENSNHLLDDREIAKIPLGPPPSKNKAAPAPHSKPSKKR